MYGRSDVNVKVERGSTFTFTRGLSDIVSILFTHVKPVKVYVRTHVKITRQWKSTFRKGISYELNNVACSYLTLRNNYRRKL